MKSNFMGNRQFYPWSKKMQKGQMWTQSKITPNLVSIYTTLTQIKKGERRYKFLISLLSLRLCGERSNSAALPHFITFPEHSPASDQYTLVSTEETVIEWRGGMGQTYAAFFIHYISGVWSGLIDTKAARRRGNLLNSDVFFPFPAS
jgi:hypothetical protein